jgi:acyl-CoA thioester hydrolase
LNLHLSNKTIWLYSFSTDFMPEAGDKPMKHAISLQVYYEDTDAGGIVYYANYLKYAERGRTELLRAAGLTNTQLKQECGILIVVKTVAIDYKRPAYLDDSLTLETEMVEIGASSMKMTQTVRNGDDVICTMDVVLVCVSGATGRPLRWPNNVRSAFMPPPNRIN